VAQEEIRAGKIKWMIIQPEKTAAEQASEFFEKGAAS